MSNIILVTNQRSIYNNFETVSIEESIDFLYSLDWISADTETTGYDPFNNNLLLTQLGDKNTQIIIDNSTIDISLYKKVLEEKPTIWQNYQFDGRFLHKYNIYPRKIYDTLLAEAVLLTGYGDDEDVKDVKKAYNSKIADKFIKRNLALDGITEKYCGVTLNKSIRGEINRIGVTDRVIIYAAEDIEFLEDIKNQQEVKWKEYCNTYNMDGSLMDLEMDSALVITRMCFNGVKINPEKYKKEVLNKVKNNISTSIKELDSNVLKDDRLKKWHYVQGDLFSQERNTEINWNSFKQKMQILPIIDPSLESTEAGELRKRKHVHPIFPALLKYNKAKKLDSSFGDKFLSHLNKKTGRIHPSVWQILSTGRISMNNPNLLQIPSKGELGKTIRSCFVPEEGKDIVGGDYSSLTK
jgi:DNA polymerase-1